MPKFRVRCDNPKTDFESASLHTAKAAAKDVSLRAHEPVRVIEVAGDGAERVVHQILQDIPTCTDKSWRRWSNRDCVTWPPPEHRGPNE